MVMTASIIIINFVQYIKRCYLITMEDNFGGSWNVRENPQNDLKFFNRGFKFS